MSSKYNINAYNFKVEDVTYTVYCTNIKHVKTILADYDLEKMPKQIKPAKGTKCPKYFGEHFKRKRYFGEPIEKYKRRTS